MNTYAVIGIIVLIFIALTSTQKVEINDKQIRTATQASCNLIKEDFDPIEKICIPRQNVNQSNVQ